MIKAKFILEMMIDEEEYLDPIRREIGSAVSNMGKVSNVKDPVLQDKCWYDVGYADGKKGHQKNKPPGVTSWDYYMKGYCDARTEKDRGGIE